MYARTRTRTHTASVCQPLPGVYCCGHPETVALLRQSVGGRSATVALLRRDRKKGTPKPTFFKVQYLSEY